MAAADTYSVRVEPMRADDVTAVAAIEKRSQTSPWPASAFADELRRDWAYVDVARACHESQESPHVVVGFCNYWLVADELQLLNLATDPDWRRRGIARELMDALLTFARARRCSVVTLEVRASNRPARSLYLAYGFREVAVRRQYYADNREDALLMDLALE